MLVVVNNQVPLDIFWGQNTIYVSAAGGDLCLPSHSHWSRELTPSFCWPTQAGAAAWSWLAPLGREMLGLISISRTRDITGGDRVTLVTLVRSRITSQHNTNIQSVVLIHHNLLLPWQKQWNSIFFSLKISSVSWCWEVRMFSCLRGYETSVNICSFLLSVEEP